MLLRSRRRHARLRGAAAATAIEGLEVRRLLAAPIVVNTTDDETVTNATTSLREAMILAGNTPGADVITFDPTVFTSGSLHTISLSQGNLAYLGGGPLDIQGPGTNTLKIEQTGGNFRVMGFDLGTDITLSGMILTGGKNVMGAGGGIAGDKLTLNNVIVTGNTLRVPDGTTGDSVTPGGVGQFARGGGIYASGDLSLTNCSVINNVAHAGDGGTALAGNGDGGTAQGGGIWAGGNLTVIDSTISSNTALGGTGGSLAGVAGGAGGGALGGGLYVNSPDAVVLLTGSTTFGDNDANGGIGGEGDATHNGGQGGFAEGGGVHSLSNHLSIPFTAFFENIANGGGGGASAGAAAGVGGFGGGGGLSNAGTATLSAPTFSGNVAIGGVSDSIGGNGAGGAMLNQNVLHIDGGLYTQNIANGGQGDIDGGAGQGGVLQNDADVDLLHVHFEDNSAFGGDAGAAGNNGGVGQGGGIWSDGNLTVTESNITGNTANAGKSGQTTGDGNFGGGGGIFANNGTVTIDSSTINGNAAIGGTGASGGIFGSKGGTGFGGGIFNVAALVIRNSTLYNNHAFGGTGHAGSGGDGTGGNATGGAIYQTIGGSLDTLNVTINANVAAAGLNALNQSPGIASGGGITNTNPNTLHLVNTIVDSNVADVGEGPDLFGSSGGGLFALDHSLVSTAAETGYNIDIANSPGYITGVSAKLDTLADNGGPTRTILPLAGSPAINAGNTAAAITAGLTFDQRGAGFPRAVRDVDIGAIEVPLPIMTVLGNGKIIVDGDTTPSSLDFTDFGTTKLGTPIDRSFTIRNDGTADLNLGLFDLPVGFSLLNTSPTTIAPGAAVGVNIRFNPGNAGSFGGPARIESNDQFEGGEYDFVLAGTTNSAAGTSFRVNFQPAASEVPSGFLADGGSAFGSRGNGYSYGFNASAASFTRERNAVADQSFDTLVHTQLFGSRTWEISVPNGTYQVHLVAGDPSFFNSVYKINVENVLTVNGTPTSGKRFIEGTKTVTVTDGKLTVTNAAGSVNNKLDFIEVTPVPPPLPTAIKVNFQTTGSSTPAGFLADSGAVFGSRGNGQSYGWNQSASSFARDRNNGLSLDQQHDTLIHTQLFGVRTWELAVPNGSYSVHIVAGDPSFTDSVYKFNAEGQLVLSGTPGGGANHWVEGTKTVVVSDGRLTITNASGSVNNKIDFIEVTPV